MDLSLKISEESLRIIEGDQRSIHFLYRESNSGEIRQIMVLSDRDHRRYYQELFCVCVRHPEQFVFDFQKDNQLRCFLVALCTGGLMEDPKLRFEDYKLVMATSESDAKSIYNEFTNASYFYGSVVGELIIEESISNK